MNKINFLKEYANKTDSWEKRTVLAALVSCLTSDITAQLLDPILLDDHILRYAILNKVKRDIENEGCQQFHVALVAKLISSFSSLPAKKSRLAVIF
jgi:hypothetical protein